MKRNQKAPDHLRTATGAWWLSVLADYELEPHHVHILTLAAEALDRCAVAREMIAREGITVSTADGGLKAHPAVGIERDARLAFARLLRELDLDVPFAAAARDHPPSLVSIRR